MTLDEAIKMYIEAADDACLHTAAELTAHWAILNDFAVYVRECEIRITK